MTDLGTWLVFAHVLGAAVWLGAWCAVCGFAANTVSQPDPGAVRRLYTVMGTLGPTVIGPATLLVLGAGLGLVARSGHTGLADGWVAAGLVLFAAATVAGIAGLRPASIAARAALDRDDLPAAVAATRRWLRLALLLTALLVASFADMVFRP